MVGAEMTLQNDKIVGFETPEKRDILFAKLKEIINTHKSDVGALIRILQLCQGVTGYLPLPVIDLISKEMDVPVAKIYSTLTFYAFFTLVPRGKHVIQVCNGTACYVKGGKNILDAIEREYHLTPGGITPDNRFSLDMVRCLGCCGLAPVMMVGEDVFREVKAAQVKEILDNYK
jgi:NADH:ubiquinone oxidoreductase subunit E